MTHDLGLAKTEAANTKQTKQNDHNYVLVLQVQVIEACLPLMGQELLGLQSLRLMLQLAK